MECKFHSGIEADLVCLQCGQPYCRQCVIETRESHYCPDCHRASVDRLAAQMGPQKEPKPPRVKEPKEPRVKEPKEPREKKLRKPAEVPLAPSLDDLKPTPPAAPPPAPTLTPQEKAAFWEVPKAPAGRPDGGGKAVEPIKVDGLPPPLPAGPPAGAPVAPPLGEGVPAPPPVKKRPIPSEEEREKAVMTAEGFPVGGGKPAKAGRAEPAEAEDEAEGAALVPERRRMRRRQRRLSAANLPVAMQVPEDYDGEVTTSPAYFKAILIAMGVGLVGSAAYAGIAWWLHRDIGLFGWVMGFFIGLAIAFGSGRHYSWKLGLIAAAIAMFWISVGRIAYFMLDLKFNQIFKNLSWNFVFRNALTTYMDNFVSLWLVFFIIAGMVAFLVAFRPPPIRLQVSGPPARRTA